MSAILLLALMPPAATPVPVAVPTCASMRSAGDLAGRWTGPFAGTDWTFELVREGAGWSGRFQTGKAQSWRPLEAVSVTGGCATFSLKSEPRLTFVLALDEAGTTLTGDIEIAGRATLPFAAARGA